MFRDTYGDDGGCAQVTAPPPPQAIGKIQTATGPVTVVDASGVVAQVKVGDPVYRHDTIETGADGAVGITFIDGTAFNLSNNARLALNEFVCDGTSNSALFSLSKGAFSFIAGKVAKTGGLRIDTPFARIRGAAQDGGIGILTLAALAFSTIREIQAASRSDAFLDDGTITYKDSPHGTFEITTKDGRVIVADDPGETIVVDPAGSVTRLPNSSSRMAELQGAQQAALATLSMGLGQQGAAPGGSSTDTQFALQQLLPINFSQLQNQGPAPLAVTITTQTNPGAIDVPTFKLLPVEIRPVLAADVGAHAVIELLHTTGSNTFDTTPAGELTFTHFNFSTVSASLDSIIWSGGATLPSGPNFAVLASALTTSVSIDSTISTSGSIATTFSAPDLTFDFLAGGETLTITYNVTVTDNTGVSLTQPVTITITGSNDAPVLAADASGPHTTIQDVQTSGTLTFTDVDLTDHHTVSTSVTSTTWPLGVTPPSGIDAVLAGALSTTTADSTGSGSGSIAVTFDAANALDFLAAGQTLTITYNVTVTDNSGVSSTQQVTITVIGTNDVPVIGGVHTGDVTEDVNVVAGHISASGALTIADVDQGQSNFTAQASTPGSNGYGTFTLAADGAWTYTANNSQGAIQQLGAGQSVSDSFTAVSSDGTASQLVTVTITGTDDAPVITAQDLIGAVTEQTTPAGNISDSGIITFTDTDLTDVHLVSPTGTPIGSVLGTLTAVLNTDTTGTGTGGQLTWTYTVADSAVEYLAKDQTKVESFTITLDDQHGGLITKQIDVTITGTDDAPVITAQDLIGAVTEQTTPAGNISDSGIITFTDTDLTDVHLVSPTGTPIGSVLGTLTAVLNTDTTGTGTGGQLTWTYTVADSAVEYLAKDQTKVESFTITLDDQHGGLITKQIDVTITGTNDAPVITAQDLIGAVTEQTTPAGNISDSGIITFTDVDLTDVHLVSPTGTPIGSVLGTLTAVLNTDTTGTGTGGQLTWTYTVADSAVEYLTKDQTKVESFTITLDDQHGGLITKQIDVTITGTDDAPVITAQDLIGAVTEQTTPAGNISDSGIITFTDTDLTDVHLVSPTGTPIGSVLGTLTAVLNTDTTGTGTGGQLTWTYTVADSAVEYLAKDQTKVESFTITLDDQHGGLITKQIDVTITGTNDAPVITAQDLIGAVTEQTTPAGNISDSGIITFTDVDLTDVHLVSPTGTPIGSVLGTLTAVLNTDTTGTGTGGQLTWTYTVADSAVEYLAKDQTKVESFTITLDDQHGGLITKQIDVTITGTNDAPVITAQDLIGAVTEQTTPTGNISDSGIITFTDVDLTDVHLVSPTGTPIGSVLGTLTAVLNTDTTGTGTGGQLTWTYTVADSAVEYLTKDQTKVESFTITLDDQHGGLITKQIDVTITGTDDAPVITAQDLIGAVTEQTTPAGNISDSGIITFTDTDLTDVHLVSPTGTPIGSVLGTLTAVLNTDTTGTGTGGQLTWTYTVADSAVEYLAKDQTKVESFTITLDDQHGGLITKQIDVTITGTNDAPVITAQDLIGAVTEQTTPAGNISDSGIITFIDVDLTDVHLVSPTGTPIGSVLGTLTAVLNTDTTGTGTGGQLTWTYTVADSAVEYLTAGQTKVESFTITLDDQHGGLITKQIDVTITGTNDQTVLTSVNSTGISTTVDESLGDSSAQDIAAITGSLAFSDKDIGDSLTASHGSPTVLINGNPLTPVLSAAAAATLISALDHLSFGAGVTSNGGGTQNISWTWDPTAANLDFLNDGDQLTITYAVQVGDSATQNLTFTITGTTDALVITGDYPLKGQTLPDPLIENDGHIVVSTNNPSTIEGSIIGTGTIEIKNNSTLTIGGSVGSGQSVLFSVDPGGGANAKLILNDPLDFHAKIQNFTPSNATQSGDQIDLEHFIVIVPGPTSPTHYEDNPGNDTGGTLKLFGYLNGDTTKVREIDLTFIDGDYTTASFKFTSDGNGGTTLKDPPTTTDALTTTTDALTTTTDALTTTTDALTTTTGASTTTTDASITTTDASTTTTDASTTTTTDASVIPVVQAPTLTAPEPASIRRNVAAAAADEAIMVAFSTAVAVALSAAASDADAGEMPSLAISGNDTAVDISGTVSGSDPSTVNSGAAPEFNPISHRMAGAVTDNERVEVVEGKLEIAAAASETGMSKADAEAILQLDGSDAANGLVITDGTNADAINLPGDHTTKTARHVSDDGRGGKVAHNAPASETGEDTTAQSTSADNHFSVSSPFTETPSGNRDHSASAFKPSVDHDATVDPGINLASIPKDQLLQHPADNLIHIPAQHDHGADPAHPHVDANQSPSFKFADDGSANPGAVPSDAPTLTALTSDPSGAHGPATRAHATDDDTPVQSAPANNGHHWGADLEINFASIPQNHSLEHPADNSPHMQHDDNGSPAVTDGAHPGRGQGDKSEPASPKFADVGDAHSAHATDEDTSVQSAPANNGHHWGADPEINLASIAKNDLPQHPADNSLHMPAQLDDNGSSAVTDGAQPAHSPFDGNQPASFKFADDGSAHPGHATGKDTSVQSTPADNDHHAIADPETNLASIAKNDLPQHPADNSSQHDDNGSSAVTDGAQPAHPHSDGNQLDTFKFADDSSAHPGTVPYDPPTVTALSSDLGGDHGPAAPALANTVNVPGTVLSDPASDKFIFGNNFGHDTVAGHKPDMTEIDQTVSTDIQHLLDTAHETNAVSTLDPNHATAPQDMTKVLPHHQGDFHFA